MAKGDAAGPPDFSDHAATEAWLLRQPREIRVAIAARSVLRVLPMLKFVTNKKMAQLIDVFVSPIFWAASLAWVSSINEKYNSVLHNSNNIGNLNFKLIYSRDSIEKYGLYPTNDITCLIDATSYSLAMAVMPQDDSIISILMASVRVESTKAALADKLETAEEFAVARQKDFQNLAQPISSDGLVASPLWPRNLPPSLLEHWQALKSHLLAADEGWEVWTDWYEARLHGDPFDPDLELARVLIDDAIWRQGPKAVNAEIARLIAEHRAKAHNELMVRIAALEATIAALKHEGSKRGPDVPPGLGHNNPPEEIDEVAEELQHNLEVLKAQPPTPNDPAAAIAAVTGLKTTLSRLTSFTGEKLDLFITEASKEGGRKFGAWAVRLAALGFGEWALDLSVKLAQVLDAALIWIRSLGVPI